ncbi:trans-aconitate methyltransferase [Streptomyces pluripotens]|uniref:Trans-aconitate 2-methyltransferase n=1 Tax=Streptomyces pluripotens TaxID=1355015 RepID=A0A221P1T8_9ACTN|nr:MULTISPECIES: trans-aconitate 2-methyltransferase [Streptomyces]ARP71807.1 trans-aconitate methyltransferase [Streptomyces pluripotens]ASN26056.1 trans-aconitate methyltransferase [Streptomyces pluripotens]KIE26221.1 trans-aconitate methyltransferase [Streptomyces sp. MUSC 125]
MTNPHWDPDQYLRHAHHRARPFTDLLARLPALPGQPPPGRPRIADLGCGPGNVTALLAERWPTAHITGYDNSPEMLDKARTDHEGPTTGGGRLDFSHADVRTWTPGEPYELIVSNATLQWVPGHADRFADWIAALRPKGTFAFQVPDNTDAPLHALMRELAATPRWKDRLGGMLRRTDSVHTPGSYLDRLARLGCATDVWQTTYFHVLAGPDPVLDWVKGTGLRLALTALADDPEARDAFLAEYRDLLRQAYPSAGYGTVLPFRRLFAVAVKGA